ncbi:MAG: DUF624 domain-containing protein [Clostridia bacterium]|nr:DUF624 domain-containing protein [Clostridia bacterium]
MKKKFNLFNFFTPKSITKDDEFAEIPTNFKGFFVMFGRKFWNISNLSLLYSLVNLPFLFIFLAFACMEQTDVISSPMLSSLYGFSQVSDNASLGLFYPFLSSFKTTSFFSTASYICFGISLLSVFTFGLSNVGAAYIIRGYNRGDPIFLVTDFFATIKKNWKQGLVVGIADVFLSFILIFDFLFWNGQSGFGGGIFMYFSLFLCVLYFIMRFYIYTITITFDLSVYKIFKDAFLLTFLGFKRNILAVFGIIVLLIVSFYLCMLYLPVGIILPIILTLALGMFMSGYASYPVIKKYMIDPYYNDEVADDDDPLEESIFEDRG